MGADKAINSLLFSSAMSPDAAALFSTRFDELVRRKSYQDRVPVLESIGLKNGDINCVLDFTGHLDGSLKYCAALDQFLSQYEQQLRDIVLLEANRPFRLSALVHVNSKLAAFELRMPRIPPQLHCLQSFGFDYWVWHSCDAPAGEGSPKSGP